MTAKVYSIVSAEKRGELKKEIAVANIIEGFGIEGDGHGGDWDRQVTCLNRGSVTASNQAHQLQMGPGDFAENILIEEMDTLALQPGDQFQLGAEAVLQVSQIGKPRSSQCGNPHLWRELAAIGRIVLQGDSWRPHPKRRRCNQAVTPLLKV